MKMLDLCDHCALNELPIVLTPEERAIVNRALIILNSQPHLEHASLTIDQFCVAWKRFCNFADALERSEFTNPTQPVLPETLTIGQGY